VHFQIKYDGGTVNPVLLREISRALEDAYDMLSLEFGSEPRTDVGVVLYPQRTSGRSPAPPTGPADSTTAGSTSRSAGWTPSTTRSGKSSRTNWPIPHRHEVRKPQPNLAFRRARAAFRGQNTGPADRSSTDPFTVAACRRLSQCSSGPGGTPLRRLPFVRGVPDRALPLPFHQFLSGQPCRRKTRRPGLSRFVWRRTEPGGSRMAPNARR